MSNVSGCRALVASILNQACVDLMGGASVTPFERYSAMNFVNVDNKLFCFYCDLLGYEPEYVAERICKTVRERKFKPILKFRK